MTFISLLPNAPANLVASGETASSVNLSWDAVEDSSGYDVYQDGTVVDTVVTNNYKVTGLTSATTYEFYVVAKSEKYTTESVPSNTVSVTTT
ncbi:fibronectin type III domain-containing protein [Virgibacillus halodenitrificans]|uniref:fibronectin type III domain-containing protein n=1 Tax=Virgibacillus halodenitrificans TaxID=1482 RepID=UPI001F278640|nr:fibronectin type III domain-containing protein [Virgibacillus halodenitrificans]MCG1029313.1 fibronectin type III domain-containing protein [Virgibacillus halodenitrificans]